MGVMRIISQAAREKRDKAYFMATGEFYHVFTEVEIHLTALIQNIVRAEAPSPHAFSAITAVIGGMRMKEAIDTLKRLYRVLHDADDFGVHLKVVFDQLTEIQAFRNRLAHHLTVPIESTNPQLWMNMDYVAQTETYKAQEVEFELAAVKNATEDLRLIKELAFTFPAIILGLELYRPQSAPVWCYRPSQLSRRHPLARDNRG